MPIAKPTCDEGEPCFRLVFTAYWTDTPPSTEVFYCKHHGVFFTYKGIAMIEQCASELLQAHSGNNLIGVIHVCALPIETDPDDIESMGWRLIETNDQ